ncbi:cytochrome c oxidase subunit II [Nostoc linckia z18]|uniref:Cytochrome c oxidase subunit 2 n=2 Tax=Nostoc linckia TaxID=92942 RepID=A0A9Q6EL28_NOSLI|nr:cytochrome c oxidase subunit II [Nostoc linckia]PHK40760.1 cytochrome c oxidase subunit II [Nostoc linckia z15]PHK46167.1 cytochrome c oxidase subunit II [Nostoc linckia z16]PHJ59742.1 cytochrome c oxidase subunit II [Nostoc linckia z1]PHJ63188.1 cytochrome c oxidase subunit II [Nostoc linckia z3]PHJ70036.1 cytochrome c oxidase subunit II [Nostoc linckia z2]
MKIQKILNILTLLTGAIAVTATSLWIGKQAYSWLPPQAAAESQLIDNLISFLVTLGSFIFLGVTSTLMYSVIFHRAVKDDFTDGPAIEGNITLEVVWTAIPILLVFWIAGYSYQVYEQMGIQGPSQLVHLHNPLGMESAYAAGKENTGTRGQGETENLSQTLSAPSLPVEKIDVIAKQWAWVFHYPEKDVTSTELHLPSDRRVRLALNSQDVLHGFYIPAFRLKQDIIPNHAIDFEFTPVRPGQYRLTDSQYSGTYFATMQANVVVESPEEYHQWLSQAATQKLSPAKNQAASEYDQTSHQSVQTGWVTVPPAAPPLVNSPG